MIENKQKFISQVMTGKSPVRSCEDIDETALSYAEVKALAAGNPNIREKMELDVQVSRLRLLKAGHDSQRYRLEDDIMQRYPAQIAMLKGQAEGYRLDIQLHEQNRPQDKDGFSMRLGSLAYTDRKDAGAALLGICRNMEKPVAADGIGEYRGFKVGYSYNAFLNKVIVQLKGSLTHQVEIGQDPFGNLRRIDNALNAMPEKLAAIEQKLANIERQLDNARMEVAKPFPKEKELADKTKRLNELNALFDIDGKTGQLFVEEKIVEFGGHFEKLGEDGSLKPGKAVIVGNAGPDIQAENGIADVGMQDLHGQSALMRGSFSDNPHPIPDCYISEVLRTGGGGRDSRSRIYAAYCHGSTPEEMAGFLKKEYGTIGKGFYFDGKPVSVWFDDRGMRLAHGASAKVDGALAFTWGEVEMQIRGMVEKGAYMDVSGASYIDKYEVGYAASMTSSFFREFGKLSNGLFMDGMDSRMEFHKVKGMLLGNGGVDTVISQVDGFAEKLGQNGIHLQGRMGNRLEKIREGLSRLKSRRIVFPLSQALLDIKEESFITQDEFHFRIGAGRSQERSFCIYDHFKGENAAFDQAGNIEFLKTEMHADSVLPALMGGEHVFWGRQGDAFVLNDDGNGIYTNELLSWDMVETGISQMIKDGVYLPPDNLEAYQQYQHGLLESSKRMECRESIEKLIKERYMGGRTPRGAARKIIEKYGWECVEDVLASSVMHRSGYGCFSKDNMEWAARILLDRQTGGKFAVNTNPSYVETFVNQVRRYQSKCRREQATMQAADISGEKADIPMHGLEKTVLTNRQASVYDSNQGQERCEVAEPVERISIKGKMGEIKESSLLQGKEEKTESKNQAPQEKTNEKAESKDQILRDKPEEQLAGGGRNHLSQKKTEIRASRQQGRISIKEKIARMREKPDSQITPQMPSSKYRQKGACL